MTPVKETRGRRGMIAAVAAALVLGALVVMFLLRSPDDDASVPPRDIAQAEARATAESLPAVEPVPERGAAIPELRLLATSTSSDRDVARSRATILDVSKNTIHVVGVGEVMPLEVSLTVDEIAGDRVGLHHERGRLGLTLDRSFTLDKVKFPMPALSDLASTSPEIVQSALLKVVASRIGRRDTESLQGQGGFAPYWRDPADRARYTDEDPHMDGLRVMRVVAGSFYDQMGLKEGDVLLAVNGERIDSWEATERALEILAEETSIRLELDGANGPLALVTETIPVSE